MLEKPDLQDEKIVACLRDEYGLNIAQVDFLPLGADRNTAVYRAIADNATSYFVKLRGGVFDEMTIIVPKLLHDQGIKHVIAPQSTRLQQLWTNLADFNLSVFPYIEGKDGYEVDLTDQHWVNFGRTLKAIHTVEMPATIRESIQRETYSAQWRESVKRFQELVENTAFEDAVAAELAAFLKTKRDEISELVSRAEDLAAVVQTRSQPFILCHADIHAGNILIDSNDQLYIVDWDTLTLAPKERDLMFVGGGQFVNKRSPQEEERLFYQGYGPTRIDASTLAYYRYERIVQDIAAYCEQILLTDGGGQDREEGLRQLTSQFLPDGVIEIAFKSEKNIPMSNFSIRPAAPDEAALLSDLAFRSKAHWDYDPVFLAACRPAMRLTPEYVTAHLVFVLELEDRLIGFYALCDLGSGVVDLDNLFVEPDAIGQGFGKCLWQHAVETARQFGFTAMRIEADPNAEPFYLAMGACRVGTTPSSVWPGRELPVLHFSVVVVS